MLKSIMINTAAQLGAKFVAAILTFITTVMVIRLGGPGLYGDLTKALSIIAIGFTAIDFGLNAEAVRSMKGSIGEQKKIAGQVMVTRGVLSVVAVIVVNIIIFLLPGGYTPAIKSVFWVGSLSIIFQGIFTSGNAWFQRRLAYWKSSLITGIGSIVGAACTYYVVRHSPTLLTLLLATSAGYGAMAVLTLLYLPKNSWVTNSVNGSDIGKMIKRSFGLGMILLLSIVASKTDSILLGVLRSSAEVGQYGFAYRIFDVLLVVPTFLMNSIYPLMVGGTATNKQRLVRRSSIFLFITGLVTSLVAYNIAPLIMWIRPGMEESINAIRILGASLPLFYLTSPRMWHLIESRQEKLLIVIYGCAAVGNGIANYFLIPHFGYIASAWITSATELFILVSLYLPYSALTKRLS